MYRILVLTVHQLLVYQRLFRRRTESALNRRLLDREPAVRVSVWIVSCLSYLWRSCTRHWQSPITLVSSWPGRLCAPAAKQLHRCGVLMCEKRRMVVHLDLVLYTLNSTRVLYFFFGRRKIVNIATKAFSEYCSFDTSAFSGGIKRGSIYPPWESRSIKRQYSSKAKGYNIRNFLPIIGTVGNNRW